MNLRYFGSGIMNNETLRKAQLKYTYELVAFDPGNAGYGVSESPVFQKKNKKRGNMFPDPPVFTSCIRG